ncbi:MAG TPA: PEP/pyruvate-binding domain-containing protein, partial [Polyangiaceae bacterium]|nr:PEP/pyruvate-binding domain-containing protein [Polyangiaceae bacterium]
MRLVIPFRELDIHSVAQVGGKNASLGELLQRLEPEGIRVPDGFAITADAYRLHLVRAGLEDVVYRELDTLDVRD